MIVVDRGRVYNNVSDIQREMFAQFSKLVINL